MARFSKGAFPQLGTYRRLLSGGRQDRAGLAWRGKSAARASRGLRRRHHAGRDGGNGRGDGMSTVVYLIGRERDLVKIGCSEDPHRRLKALRVANGQDVSIIAQMPGDFHTERSVQEHFAHLRTRGEWFRDEGGTISAFFAKGSTSDVATWKTDNARHMGRRASADRAKYRANFASLWAGMLRQNFENNVEAAAFFGVTERAVLNWMHETANPSGWIVAYAVKNIPGAAMMLEAA
jgi:hypothetical protein